MKQSLTRYIAIVNTKLNKLSITRGTRTWRQRQFSRKRSGINSKHNKSEMSYDI